MKLQIQHYWSCTPRQSCHVLQEKYEKKMNLYWTKVYDRTWRHHWATCPTGRYWIWTLLSSPTFLLMQLIILIQFIMEGVTFADKTPQPNWGTAVCLQYIPLQNQALNGNNLVSGFWIVSRSWLGAIMGPSQIQFICESAWPNSCSF